MSSTKALAAASLLLTCAALSGCASVALTAAGVGGSAAFQHAVNGSPYRTFSAPRSNVKTASLGALKRMGMKVTGNGKADRSNDVITATAAEREIEIHLEALSASTTRMQVVARNGSWFYDGATANEIIAQTERQLNLKLSAK